MNKVLLFVIFCILGSGNAKAQEWPDGLPDTLSDSAEVSILTSAPWAEKVYSIFGHSEIRVCDPKNNIDWVFNYGAFDPDSPNFIFRFISGQTDYMVMPSSFESYMDEYKNRGVDVYEQVINMTPGEKQQVWRVVKDNSRPENRVFRYNVFFNNCTTKLRDILENNVNKEIVYPKETKTASFRSLLHEYVEEKPWIKFGGDLVLGSGADSLIQGRTKMFLPICQMDRLGAADVIKPNNSTNILVSNTEEILTRAKRIQEPGLLGSLISPINTGILVLLISVLVSLYDYKKKRFWGTLYDTILFAIAGIAGLFISFMIFVSVHPCTSNNWNIVWLNPLQLIAAPLFFIKPLARYIYYYHFINFLLLILLLLGWVLIPQQLNVMFIPFILSIALRSGVYIYRKHMS